MEQLMPLVLAVFASTGFWQFVINAYNLSKQKESNYDKLILGVAYHIIRQECESYIQKGEVTTDEYADLKKYLYEPYRMMGGNGTCEKLMKEVEKLPIGG